MGEREPGPYETDDQRRAPDDPEATLPNARIPAVPAPASVGASDDPLERTADLPPDFVPRDPPKRPKPPGERSRRGWLIGVSVLLLVAVAAGAVFAATRGGPDGPSGGGPRFDGCGDGTPCQAATLYLAAYTGARYDDMYALVSDAAIQRFSDPNVLRPYAQSDFAYKDAREYIISRTGSLLQRARVYALSATPGAAIKTSALTADVPAQIEMQSSRLGVIEQDVTLRLRYERDRWRVDWTPGLVFSQLDDPGRDPYFHRKVDIQLLDGRRGTIYDRDGKALAKDDTVYSVYVTRSKITDEAGLLKTLGSDLDFTAGQLRAKYAGAPADQPVLVRMVAPQLWQRVGNEVKGVAGVAVRESTGRVYPYGVAAATVTGFVGVINADDIKNDTQQYYDEPADVIGRDGVEFWGEAYLRPQNGGKLQVWDTNADGSEARPVSTIAARDAVNGADVHSTISIDAQQQLVSSVRALQGDHGVGAVALEPTTGAVLAMVSNPAYDPNDLALGLTPNAQARLNALDHPYLNRVLQSSLEVGSVFKLVTLAAALENGIPADQTFTDPTGKYTIPGTTFTLDENTRGHGSLTAARAVPPSCDVIFAQIALLLNQKDPNILPDTARAFGYGAPTGIVGVAEGGETPGLVPDPEWLQKTKPGSTWSVMDAYLLSLGQVFQATPLQVAQVTAALGNNGIRMRPRLVSSVTSVDGKTLVSYAAEQVGTLPISAEHLAMMQRAMYQVTQPPSGTAQNGFKRFPLRVAGKTGTAEVQDQEPNGWFTGYAPYSSPTDAPVAPQIATAIAIPRSGYGARTAVPITRDFLTRYFKL